MGAPLMYRTIFPHFFFVYAPLVWGEHGLGSSHTKGCVAMRVVRYVHACGGKGGRERLHAHISNR